MTAPLRHRTPPAFLPRLMQATAAAHYLGCSPSKLRTLPIRRLRFGGNVVYDRGDLDAFADSLPYEGGEEINTCDGKFGAAR